MKSIYFPQHGGIGSEQSLIQNLVDEQIKLFGTDVYYLPRKMIMDKTLDDILYSEFGILLFVISCSDSKFDQEDEVFLNIYMNSEMTGSHYLVKYNSTKDHSYTSVYYQTDGLRYIEWFSDDEFCVEFMNDTICDPIVNYTTYSREDGSGKQMIRLQRSFIGDTLEVKGCISNDLCKSLSFIVY